ncbi:MAG: hypothetical protein JWO11_3914 [Nocardioides sp.]|nr:hypothetical protein [Nocardioides sp.]
MTTYSVAATFKGERVYLGTQTYPRQTLLTLNFEAVPYSDLAEARKIEVMAERDETLTDVRVQVL